MKNLLKKFRENKKGFTLAELLVVVAIVGILVAISIPVFTAQLGKARQATNNANLRAAKAAAVSAYLTDDDKTTKGGIYEYTVKTGEITVPATAVTLPDKVEINDAKEVSKTEVYETIYVQIKAAADDKNEEVTLHPVTTKTTDSTN